MTPSILRVNEGEVVSITVRLTSEPASTATFEVDLVPSHVTSEPNSLRFNTTNWSEPQTIRLTFVEDVDAVDEFDRVLGSLTIGGVTRPLSSILTLYITDNDKDDPALQILPQSLTVAEGGSSTFTVRLSSQPTDPVTVAITGVSGTDLTLDETSLTFTRLSWSIPQTVRISADEDLDAVNDVVTLPHTASGAEYADVTANLFATVTDDDAPGRLLFSPASLTVAEGSSAPYTVRLSSQPTGPVTVAITGQSGTDLTLNMSDLTFNPSGANLWSTAQTVMVSADEDSDASNDMARLLHTASGANYGSVMANLIVTVTDDEEPAVNITGVPAKINSTAAFTATFTWSDDVTGFATGDVTVTGGTKGTFTAANGSSYTLAVTPDGSADVVVTVPAHSASAGGLNTGPATAVSETATWDTTAPTVRITGIPAKINSTAALNVTFAFSEDVNGFATGDVTVTGGTKGVFSGSGRTYTLVVTPDGSADVVVTVAADAATDGLNTGPATAVSATATWDATAPSVAIGGVPSKINSTTAFTATFTWSENVTGFVTGDVTVTGGTKGAFTAVNGSSYTLAMTPDGSADVVVTVTADGATDGFNTGPATATTATATWDATAPAVTIGGVPSKINSTTAFTATFTWSENVTGFVTGDVTVTGGTKGAFSGSGRTYTLAVTPISGSNVTVTVAANSASDGLNTGPATEVSRMATWDAATPMVTIGGVPAKINSTAALTATFMFSEDVTGFVTGDVTVTGGTKGAFTEVNGSSYTLAMTPTGSADVVVTVAASAATDGLNTGPPAAVSATATWDAAAPMVDITGVPAKINSTAALTATFTFSEDVNGFVTGDVTVTGGTKGMFSGSGKSYTLAVTPSNGADVTVTVAANSASDGLNTGPATEVSATATWDAAAPSVAIGGMPAKINSTAALSVNFNWLEDVTGFAIGDVTVIGGTKGAFSGSGRTYTLAVTPISGSNVTVTVAANSASDGLNTGPATEVSRMATWDAATPMVTIGGVPAKINSTAALTATFMFSEDVTGFVTGDVTVTGGTKGAFTEVNGSSYTLAMTPTGSADVVVTVAASAATDGLNTGPPAAVSATATWDAATPMVTIGGVPAKINSTAALTATFMFSEDVTGFVTGDVTVTGGTKGAFTEVNGSSYTLAMTPTGSADVVVTVAASAATDGLNTGPPAAVSATATWDAATPMVDITGVPAKINSTAALTATFTFSEDVTGFVTGDVTVTGGTKGAFTEVNGSSYTLAMTPTGSADVVVTVAASAATDGLNTGPPAAVSATATWDAAAPMVDITGVPAKINSTAALTATFTFSEDVNGFVAGDVTVTGGTKGTFSGSGKSYTLAVTPSNGADVTISVAANSASDGLNTGPATAVSATATWDAVAPSVAIGGMPAKINSTAALSVTFMWLKNVTGFVAGDVTVTGGAKGAFTEVNGSSYTLAVTPISGSNVTVTVAANSATDGVNTGPATEVSTTATWDAATPMVAIGGVPAKINSTTAFTATFTWSEDVTGFVTGDVTVTGGTKGAFTAVNGSSYALAMTPTGSADMVVTVRPSAATDGLNTGPATEVSAIATWDAATPMVTIGGVPAKINSTTAFIATFTWSEDVNGFVTGDVTLTGGTKGAFTAVNGSSYTLAMTPTGSADMVVTVAASAATDGLNTGPPSAVSATAMWDSAAPMVEIGGVPSRISSTAALTATFTFSEDVTGFVTGDVTVTGGTKGTFSGSGKTYTLAVTPSSGSNVTVTVEANSATDGLNTGPATAVSATAMWDAMAPSVAISGMPAKINSTAGLSVTFTWLKDVTGFATGDVTVTGGTKGTFSGSGKTYTLAVTPSSGADVTVTVVANSATDGLNTGPATAISATSTWDAVAPSVAIGGMPAEINSTAALSVTFMWLKDVTGFATGDVTVTGGTKGAFTEVNGSSYTLAVTPISGSNVTVTVAANAASDGLNTGPATEVSAIATWDAATPMVGIGGVPAKINSTTAFIAMFTWSEDVNGFATGDVTVTGGTKGTFSGSGKTYTLAVTPSSGSNVTVTVEANSATDGLNTGPATAVSATAMWDAMAPSVAISGMPAKINSTAGLSVTFTWLKDVTGFATGDVTVTGGTKGTFSGSGKTYTLAVTPSSGSNVTVTVEANSATDGLNTGPATAISATSTWDAAAATVTVGDASATEGDELTFTVTLDQGVSEGLTVTPSFTDGTATRDIDYTENIAALTFAGIAGETQTFTVATTEDALVEDDETFTVGLTVSGTTEMITATDTATGTITDDDTAPTRVNLVVAPNPVDEGEQVTVTARLSRAPLNGVTIPLTLTAGTAESGDYGSLTGISIASGATMGTGTIAMVADADRDDETFTVALGALPDGLAPGSPSSVEVTIRDRTPPPNRPPTVTASCHPCAVPRGGEVRLEATATDPDGDPLTYSWSAPRGGFAGADEPVAHWTAPEALGTMAIRVEVSDERGGSASSVVEVAVVNREPSFGQPAYGFELPENVDGRESPSEIGRVEAEDQDGDELTYELAAGDRQRFAVGALDGVVRYIGSGEDFETLPNRFELAVRLLDEFGEDAWTEVAVEVTDVNEAPEAADDQAVTPEDQAVAVDVLANDTDPEGDQLRVRSVTAAAHGAVRHVSGGRVTYTPEADFHGTDSFTYVAGDGRGLRDTAMVVVTVLPVNDAPTTVGAIPDQALDEGGGEVHVDLSPYFVDMEGDALTYSARSSDTGVVLASVEGTVLALTPVVYGSAMVTVTARDPVDLTTAHSVRVGVSDRPQRAIVGNVLAATARGHLASLRAALGHRMAAGPCEASRLAVMGRSVPLGRTEATIMLGQIGNGGRLAAAALSLDELAVDPGGAMRPQVGQDATTTDRIEAALPSVPARALGIGGGSAAAAADFLVGWGGPEGHSERCPVRGRWALWGQGDVHRFEGTPSVHGHDSGYDGELSTAYVGLDTRLGPRWLVGVALSRSKGESDWRAGTSEGRLTQFMTAVHPYLQWTGWSMSVWASVGAGGGDARNVRAAGRTGTSATDFRLGLVELERRLGAPGGLDFAILGDAAWARLSTGDGDETINRQEVAVNQVRLGADLSLPARLGRAELTPFGTVHARRDGGAGQTGDGIEVAGGLRSVFGIVRLDASARMLAHHSAEGYGERGAAVTLALGKQGTEEGFSLSVSPRWGDPARATGALQSGPLGGGFRSGPDSDRWTLDARASYGVSLPGGLKLNVQGSYGAASGAPGFGLYIGRPGSTTGTARRMVPAPRPTPRP